MSPAVFLIYFISAPGYICCVFALMDQCCIIALTISMLVLLTLEFCFSVCLSSFSSLWYWSNVLAHLPMHGLWTDPNLWRHSRNVHSSKSSYRRERQRTNFSECWVGFAVGVDAQGQRRPHWDSIPDCPDHKQFINRLHQPAAISNRTVDNS